MSRASSSLNWKLGMVAVAAYACGFLSQAKIHSRVVLSATCASGGGSSVAVMTRPSGDSDSCGSCTQPYRASMSRPGVQLRRSGERSLMALAAGRFQVARRQDGLLPGFGAACASSTVVAAPCPRWHITQPNSVEACGIGGCGRNGCATSASDASFKPDVAGGAAVDYFQFRQPDLLHSSLKPPGERNAVAAVADQFLIVALIAQPLAKMIFGGYNRQQQQQDDTEGSERARAIAEEEIVVIPRSRATPSAQPAPRKNVPMAVSMTAAVRNQDMIQKGSGFDCNQRRNFPGFAAGNASRNISAGDHDGRDQDRVYVEPGQKIASNTATEMPGCASSFRDPSPRSRRPAMLMPK